MGMEVGLIDTWAKKLESVLFFFVWGSSGSLSQKGMGLFALVDISLSRGFRLIRNVFHSVTRLTILKVPHQTNNDSAASFGIFLITLQPTLKPVPR